MGQQPLSPINQKAVFTKNVMKDEIWRALRLAPDDQIRAQNMCRIFSLVPSKNLSPEKTETNLSVFFSIFDG